MPFPGPNPEEFRRQQERQRRIDSRNNSIILMGFSIIGTILLLMLVCAL